MAVPDGRDVPSWLQAAACESRRNRGPDPPRPREGLKPRRPDTPVLRPGGVHAADRRRTGLQGAGGASSERPHAAGRGAQIPSDSPANRTGPAPKQASDATRPGTAARAPQSARVSGTARVARLRGSHLDSDIGAGNPSPVSGHHLSKTIPIDGPVWPASDTCPIKLPLGMDVPPSVLAV